MTGRIEGQANGLIADGLRGVARVPFARARAASATHWLPISPRIWPLSERGTRQMGESSLELPSPVLDLVDLTPAMEVSLGPKNDISETFSGSRRATAVRASCRKVSMLAQSPRDSSRTPESGLAESIHMAIANEELSVRGAG